MSSPALVPSTIVAPASTSVERRKHARYPILLKLSYRLLHGLAVDDVGETINLSSGGVLFAAGQALPADAEIVVVINWPVMLDEVALNFKARGKVVRSDKNGIAVVFVSHEFRTRGRADGDSAGINSSAGHSFELR